MFENGRYLSPSYRFNAHSTSKIDDMIAKRRKIIPKSDPIRDRIDSIGFDIEQALEI